MTPQKEDYLKVIFQLGGDKELVNNKLIGKQLAVSAASVTEMSTKLLKDGFIVHVPYQGVKLSEKGLLVANQLIRKHRLWETFLSKHLGYSWEEVHDLAENLEHVSSTDLINRLDEFLGFPAVDPHGGAIPDQDGVISERQGIPLQRILANESFQIMEVDDDSDFLKYFSDKALQLRSVYTLREIEDFEGPIHLEDEGGVEYQLSHKAAAKIWVTKR